MSEQQLSDQEQTGESGALDNPSDPAEKSEPEATPDESENKPSVSGNGHSPAGKRRALATAAIVTSTIAALIAIIAVGASALIWRQAGERLAGLEAMNAALSGQLDLLDSRIEGLDQDLSATTSAAGASQDRLQNLESRLDIVPSRLAEFGRRIDAIAGGSFDARATWLRAEAEYYLVIANAELTLAGHWENAMTALRLADERLRRLADPSLAGVRQLIAGEIAALRAVQLPDIEGIAFGLARLADRVESLPFPAGLPNTFQLESPDDSNAAGWRRLWNTARNAFSSLIRIERSDAPAAAVLSAEERRLLRRQLSVELQLARLAAVRSDQQNFVASLAAVRSLLTNFDTNAAEVDGAVLFLDELERIRLLPEPPDISMSLSALRAAAPGAD